VIRNFRNFSGGLLISLWLTLLGASACHRSQESRAVPFPASNEVVGWVRTGDIRTFQAADLWKYIDGDAERYMKAGVQTVSTADYRFRDKFDAVVDVYTMATLAGANEICESEPAGDAKLISLGDGARLYGQSLVLHKGPFLVRITAYEDSVETQPALLGLGRGIERRLTH
jgi:Family of unknown function (DUF6599)